MDPRRYAQDRNAAAYQHPSSVGPESGPPGPPSFYHQYPGMWPPVSSHESGIPTMPYPPPHMSNQMMQQPVGHPDPYYHHRQPVGAPPGGYHRAAAPFDYSARPLEGPPGYPPPMPYHHPVPYPPSYPPYQGHPGYYGGSAEPAPPADYLMPPAYPHYAQMPMQAEYRSPTMDDRYLPPPQQQQGKSKEEIIRELEETRLKVEMPCRTLFVRNLGYRADGRKIEAAFSKYGPLKDAADLIEKRGLMFITFYDSRHAERALKELHGSVVENRKLDVHYSLPKQEVDVQGPCTKDKNQGTLLVQLVGAKEKVASDEFERIVKAHGDVGRVRDFKNNDMKKFFEFYDSRDCVKAFNALSEAVYKGGKFVVEYAWDLPESMRVAQASVRGDPFRGGADGGNAPPVRRSDSRRDYDRYVPPGEQSGKKSRSRRRSASPDRRTAKRDSTGSSRVETRSGAIEAEGLVFFEDKQGHSNPPLAVEAPAVPRDPRRQKVEENRDNADAPPPSNALFEQMSNLLSALNRQETATKTQIPSPAAPSQPSAAAAQQLAELLLNRPKP